MPVPRQKKLWSAKWEPVPDQEWHRSGGQGTLRLLRPIRGSNPNPSVLKELNKQTDPDRRRRMRREVVTLETIPHLSTPRLLDHNTEHFMDLSVDLYAIFEFISGSTLGEYVAEHGPLCIARSVELTTALLSTIEVYHEAGVGHRDIKPDNVMLRDNDPSSPVLIDFGLSFNVDDSALSDTPDWQQVGNRFLALPEHAAFSGNKQDLRSDMTFCCAILFFAVTGIHPATLADEEGRLPHQRPEARLALEAVSERERIKLLNILDIGFSFTLAQRWQSIDSLRTRIQRISMPVNREDDLETSIEEIQARAEAKSGNLLIKDALDQARGRIKSAALSAISKLGAGFAPSIEERLTTMDNMSTWIRCGVAHVYDGGLTNTFYGVNALGDELVIRELSQDDGARADINAGQVVARLPLQSAERVSDLESLVERRIISNVHGEIAGT